MIAAVVVATVAYRPNDFKTFEVSANVAGNPSVSPDDVIRVSFNQAVDHTAVERNLQIHPATAVQTRWDGTVLVITPLHHLAANTPYTVTIPRTAVVGSGGHVASSDIRITFGTAATPNPGQTGPAPQPPVLQPQPLGLVGSGSQVIVAPDGSVVADAALIPPATPGASPSAATGTSLDNSGLPGLLGRQRPTPTSPSAARTSAASPTPAEASVRLARLNAGASPTELGPAALSARFSPSGRSLAYLVADGQGADLVVSQADGSRADTLVRGADAGSPLAWAGEDSLLYLSGGQVWSVDLQGRSRSVGGGLHIAAGQDVALAPGGHVAYVGPLPGASPTASPSDGSEGATPDPSTTGHLVDLATGVIRPLQGVRQLPAFSGDGNAVAWVDESGSTPVLDTMATGDDSATPTAVPTTAGDGDVLANLALSGDGGRLAYTVATHGIGTPALRVVTTATGDPVGLGDGLPVLFPALSQNGDAIAFVRTGSDGSATAMLAQIPGATAVQAAPDAMPADASTVLDRFLEAQAQGDLATLRSLAGGSLSVGSSLAPPGIDRYYVIKAALDTDGSTAVAHVRLVRDASSSRPVASADETVTLARPAAGQAYQVTSVALGAFATEPNGPQVVHVDTERQPTALVVRVTFDSDLDPATVTAAAISLLGPQGALVSDVSYEVESRTAVIRVLDVPSGTLTLTLSGGIHDISGTSLASGFSTSLRA
jgi:hypothetical protein